MDNFQLYKETFEHPLQQSCQAYYHDKANEWKGLTDSVAFIENVATLMESEKHLAESLMNASTVSVVEHWTADTLVADKVKTLKLSFKSHMTAENFNCMLFYVETLSFDNTLFSTRTSQVFQCLKAN